MSECLTLPVDAFLDEVRQRLRTGRNLVLVAEPGAGKTTRVPPALLLDVAPGQSVVILEPRRLAARLAAARVAEERGERLGDTVGYQVRFEAARSPRTRLLFVTEGVLLRRLQSSPTLSDVAVVILDEFHERHLTGDVSLAMVRRLQRTARPEVRIVVMSATMEAGPIAAYLGACDVLHVPGRVFPLTIEYAEVRASRPLETQVAEAAVRALRKQPGDVLAFLPGARDIRRSAQSLSGLAEVDVRPLHGDMPLDLQRQAILPGPRRKIVLATNVAESSITVEGVHTVIDSGLARVARYSHWSGLPRLDIERISQASAVQRAGRAGRRGPGLAMRLFSRADYDLRAPFDTPEVHRTDLTETVLELLAAGIHPASLEWFEAPQPVALEAAWETLFRLLAVDDERHLTPRGVRMAQFPVHPRLAALMLAGDELGVGDASRGLAALLSYRDILVSNRGGRAAVHASDLLLRLERFYEAAAHGLTEAACEQRGLDRGTALQVQRLQQSLGVQAGSRRVEPGPLQQAIMVAFCDRLAHRPRPATDTLLLSRGGSATLSSDSCVRGPWLVTLDAEERSQGGRSSSVVVRSASEFDTDWLYERYLARLVEVVDVRYNETAQRVEQITRLMYDQLIVEESMRVAPPSAEASRILVAAAWKLREHESDKATAWRHRYDLLRGLGGMELPPLDDERWQQALLHAAAGLSTLADLRQALDSGQWLRHVLPPGVSLDALLPASVSLPRRRNVPIHYEADRPPWIASRLQDFFGLQMGPAIMNGRVPLVLHLLAPNGRDVQVTSDLAGFWQRTYPQVRKSLHRQYPKHAWPEDPLHPNRIPPPP